MHIFKVLKTGNIMDIFKGQNVIEFTQRFITDEDCKVYLSELKWSEGYFCKKCGHTKSQIRENLSRTCNICSHTESPTAGTLFHKVKFGLHKAFFICFEMATTTKSLSALQTSVRFCISQPTARMFMHKVRTAMESSNKDGAIGEVHVDEFTIGGHEEGKPGRSYNVKKKKIVCLVELDDKRQVKRFYANKIDDYSAKSLVTIFNDHIDKEANVVTDLWKGYRPISKDYNITQIPSNKGQNFIALHNMIHQVKSWIRTIYSWVSPSNINRYLNEFSFRINRSQSKNMIFNNLIKRMINHEPVLIKSLIGN